MRRRKTKLKTMDKILIIMAVAMCIFTIAMVVIFCIFQAVPDTLITAFFGACGAEGGFMGVIQVAKKIMEGKGEKSKEIDL